MASSSVMAVRLTWRLASFYLSIKKATASRLAESSSRPARWPAPLISCRSMLASPGPVLFQPDQEDLDIGR